MKFSFNKSLLIVLTLLALIFNTSGVTSVYAMNSKKDGPLLFPQSSKDHSPRPPVVTAPPAFTNDTTPTIRGRAEAGTRVNVWYVDASGNLILICKDVVVRGDDDDDRDNKLRNRDDDDDDSGKWSCTPSQALPEGEIELVVNATDRAGHTSANTSYFFTIITTGPTTGPTTQIDSQPANPSNSPDATFTFSSTDPTATFECQLDGGGFSACTSPVTYTGLPNGSHTFEVRARDTAGNTDPTPASYTWIVNTNISGVEIQVLDGTTDIPDGTGTVDFGTTPFGTPVIRTFTVTNIGTADLTLTGPISVPAGFSLVSSFGSLTLAPATSTSFQVRLDAVTTATYNGEVSFGNNDADENPFNFTVTGLVTNQTSLTLTASGASTVKPGDQYTYTLSYTAAASVSNAQVSLTLPGHTTFVSSDKSCTVAGGIVTCDLGSLGAGSGSFNFTVLVDKLKKVGIPLTLATTSYSISATGVTAVNGLTTVTADVLTPFADVPLGYLTLDYIQSIWAAGVTSGCAQLPLRYCPESPVRRGEAATLIERGMGNFSPTPSPTGMFADIPYPGMEAYTPFIEELYNDGIWQGCSQSPLMFCPQINISRAEAAMLVERAIGNFSPTPSPTGMFADVPYPGLEAFTPFIEQLYNDHITVGCLQSPLIYCPQVNITRSDMAVFIERAFHLPMPS